MTVGGGTGLVARLMNLTAVSLFNGDVVGGCPVLEAVQGGFTGSVVRRAAVSADCVWVSFKDKRFSSSDWIYFQVKDTERYKL